MQPLLFERIPGKNSLVKNWMCDEKNIWVTEIALALISTSEPHQNLYETYNWVSKPNHSYSCIYFFRHAFTPSFFGLDLNQATLSWNMRCRLHSHNLFTRHSVHCCLTTPENLFEKHFDKTPKGQDEWSEKCRRAYRYGKIQWLREDNDQARHKLSLSIIDVFSKIAHSDTWSFIEIFFELQPVRFWQTTIHRLQDYES